MLASLAQMNISWLISQLPPITIFVWPFRFKNVEIQNSNYLVVLISTRAKVWYFPTSEKDFTYILHTFFICMVGHQVTYARFACSNTICPNHFYQHIKVPFACLARLDALEEFLHFTSTILKWIHKIFNFYFNKLYR